MNCYDFFLSVVPVGSEGKHEVALLPRSLKLARDELRGTSERARATMSRGTTLKVLLNWLNSSRDQIAEKVKQVASSYQEHRRLEKNLEENMSEVKRANELSVRYKERAAEVVNEAAQIAGFN